MFRVVSLNVRGISSNVKRRAIFDNYRVNADILLLQETHSCPEIENLWQGEWGGKIVYSHGTTASKGVAACITKKLYEKVSNIYKSTDGRCIILDIEENDQIVTLAAIYAPNKDDPQYFRNLTEILRNRHENKIIVGDFNLTMNAEMDRKNTFCNNNQARDEVENMMDEFCLKDIWRIHYELQF